MKKNEIQVKKSLEIEAAALVLEELAASLRAGKICIESHGEFVSLNPAEVLDLELKAGQKKNKNKLSLVLYWREIVPSEQVETFFKISSQEPEIVEEPEAAAVVVEVIEETVVESIGQ